MKVCPACQHTNREGFLYCESCGDNLLDTIDVTLPTKEIAELTNSLYTRANWGTARFTDTSWLMFHVRESSVPLNVRPTDELILGRADTTSPTHPDVDLAPFGGLEKGVSRVHAAVCRSEGSLLLIDKASANGTYLNGQRLAIDQPRVLRDGDEIRLGRLVGGAASRRRERATGHASP